jgi:hypothetical protein
MVPLLVALVTVIVHNTAEVPRELLTRAQAQVEHVFADAGLTLTWTDGRIPGAFAIHVIIRRRPGGGPGAASPSALGTTISSEHAEGGSSFIFYDRVLSFAHAHTRPADVILAYAMAHELGHVLLPAPAHTASGLMKPEWSDDDLRYFNAGLHFTATQAAAMQAKLSRCCQDD